MFAKETYVARRRQLKKSVGSGLLLFLGNDAKTTRTITGRILLSCIFGDCRMPDWLQ